ncbi:TetR/AcrR family transcriptional regulator [Sphingomonas aliaeris]|uniref:TetR/AcrR family transcriptional regulator n=1 Tax=Sphingomonas aliaeris TaxID=2759526 RepID=A0A974NSB2_9SPHN|nr:TetR/AcrR family transcriptional regulator [Sphingomonas aliaeris]QQV76009.1 TetR/AcrR family transcriptional regulator [Sphingomonas aliaeris]
MNSSHDRLIDAVIHAWERDGAAGVSARAIARDAAIPVSSIYHHFGDMDGLLLRAGEVALGRATRWFDAQSHELAGMFGDPTAFAHLLSAVIDDWCERQRPLAYAWREIQSLAMRDPRHGGAAGAWWTMAFEFWRPVCDRFGIGDLTGSVVLTFDEESSLHLIRWRRLIDRAALSELCGTWAGWAGGRTGIDAPWRTLAMREALAGQPVAPGQDAVTEDIADAAARTVAQRGVSGLTHRAVAEEAGQTLGIVSNRFRSSADLLRAACYALYRQIVRPFGESDTPIDLIAGAQDRGGDDLALRAFFELTLAASREPALQPFAAQLRYLRGRTSIRHLRAISPADREPSVADGALLSTLFSSQNRIRLAGVDLPGIDQGVEAMLARLSKR